MNDQATVLAEILQCLRGMEDSLHNIDLKLSSIDGTHTLDDIAEAILDIKSDLSNDLPSIENSLSNIDMNTGA